MRITYKVLCREASYSLKEKGYEILSMYFDTDGVIINYKLNNGSKKSLVIEQDEEGCYIYSVITSSEFRETISQRNHLANLRLFIEGEL